MFAPFEAPRLKIARAHQHIAELERAIGTYLARQPFALMVERWQGDPGGGVLAWVVRIREPVPHDLSPVLGDAIHNMRASLDLLAADLVRKANRNTKGVYFPFAETAAGLIDVIKRKNFDRAGRAAVDLLKSLEPYKGGNVGLRAIHDMDVRDKHLALLPVAHGLNLDLSALASKAATADARRQLASWGSRVERDGQEIVLIPTDWSPPIGTKIKATYSFGLDEPNPIGGDEIIATLKQLADICDAVVSSFESISR